MLRRAGLPVLHERVGKAGSVSSYFVVDDYWYQGGHLTRERLSDFVFDETWHLVRHPLLVIASLRHAIRPEWWHWQEKHTGIGEMEPTLRSALFWHRWTEMADAASSWRIRIEDIEREWPEIQRRTGSGPLESVRRDGGGKHRPPLTWGDLESASTSLASAIRKRAHEYGYEE